MDSLSDFIAQQELKFRFESFVLKFKKPSGTSRGILTEKYGWLLYSEAQGINGLGECSIIPGLSPDFEDLSSYEHILRQFCSNPVSFLSTHDIRKFPSLLFGLESAVADWKHGGKRIYFDSLVVKPALSIPINGLVWMGSQEDMQQQVSLKLEQGFRCIKMKVGAIGFQEELAVIRGIRERFNSEQITIRVDANGAFSPEEAPEKLKQLADLDVHSIEQPIKAGNWPAMANLCQKTPLPIALDEELIGITKPDAKKQLLETIRPQYIILKPSLHGGISGTNEWITLANSHNIPWWMTSALESNVGLNVIAQLTATYSPVIPQGLGTGGLYETNFDTPLWIEQGQLKGTFD